MCLCCVATQFSAACLVGKGALRPPLCTLPVFAKPLAVRTVPLAGRCPLAALHPRITGAPTWSSILNVLLSTGMTVGLLCGAVLDNIIPGTDRERGLHGWKQWEGADEQQEEPYHTWLCRKLFCCCRGSPPQPAAQEMSRVPSHNPARYLVCMLPGRHCEAFIPAAGGGASIHQLHRPILEKMVFEGPNTGGGGVLANECHCAVTVL